MNKVKLLSHLFLFTFSSLAMANAYAKDHSGEKKEHQKFKEREDGMNSDLRSKISSYKPRQSEIKPLKKPDANAETTIACGDVITKSITIANDLDCSSSYGFAVRVLGSNITVNANGHKIIAPNAAAGLYVEGENNIIANFNIQGVVNGYGMLAYNAPSTKILSNNFSKNKIGIMIYTDKVDSKMTLVQGNRASFNSFAGIRTYSDDLGTITNPYLKKNDFSNSGEYAIYIKALNFSINEESGNIINGSSNGYYLKDGNFSISNLSLADQLIYKRHFFVDSAKNIVLTNVDVSSRAPLTPNQDRMGIDLYRVANFSLINVLARFNDVGLKLETESGVSPTGYLKDCQFSDLSLSGIFVVSYDSTPYGAIKVIDSEFNLASNVGKFIVASGTVASIEFINVSSSDDGQCDESRDSDDDRDVYCEQSRDCDKSYESRDCDRNDESGPKKRRD